MGKKLNLINKQFGRLTVLSEAGKNKQGSILWFCICRCNAKNKIIARGSDLKNGHTKSCGCLKIEALVNRNTKHGYSSTKNTHLLYWVWSSIIQRCTNKNNKRFKDYGGRGINIHKPWLKNSKLFIKWCLSNGYQKGLTIERKNNDKGYSPNNCVFIKPEEQAKNTRRTRYLTFNNKTLSISEWSKITKIKVKVLSDRINKLKWSIEKTLTKSPIIIKRKTK